MKPASPTLLIVDDDYDDLATALSIATQCGYQVRGASSVDEAFYCFAEKSYDVTLWDLYLSSADSIEPTLKAMQHLKSQHPHVCMLVYSGARDAQIFSQALAAGALGVIKKPLLSTQEFTGPVQQVWLQHGPSFVSADPLIVLSEEVTCSLRAAVSAPHLPVVITGETGTGKEHTARHIHTARCAKEGKNMPFVPVNCSLLEGDLAASLVFGHKKGAFSGAYQSSPGLLGEADGGIMFLDEIHHMPMSMQKHMLRVLNDGTYYRVGETKEQKISVQWIVASTMDLDEAVARGRLLMDLRMRLMGITIDLRPLRERRSEIEEMVLRLLHSEKASVSPAATKRLLDRCRFLPWPGNMRELHQKIRAALSMSRACDNPDIAFFLY
jgi:DNA-binding NtrC family response regulator